MSTRGIMIGGPFDGQYLTSLWPVTTLYGPPVENAKTPSESENLQRYRLIGRRGFPVWAHSSVSDIVALRAANQHGRQS